LSQYKIEKKVTNEQASEYDISLDTPFYAITISNPQKKISQSMGKLTILLSAGN
jgi:hypothetical protein